MRRESVERKGENSKILPLVCSNSVKIFEKTLTVWSLLNVVTVGGCFQGKKGDLKMERRA